jgi:hypothetical protein
MGDGTGSIGVRARFRRGPRGKSGQPRHSASTFCPCNPARRSLRTDWWGDPPKYLSATPLTVTVRTVPAVSRGCPDFLGGTGETVWPYAECASRRKTAEGKCRGFDNRVRSAESAGCENWEVFLAGNQALSAFPSSRVPPSEGSGTVSGSFAPLSTVLTAA